MFYTQSIVCTPCLIYTDREDQDFKRTFFFRNLSTDRPWCRPWPTKTSGLGHMAYPTFCPYPLRDTILTAVREITAINVSMRATLKDTLMAKNIADILKNTKIHNLHQEPMTLSPPTRETTSIPSNRIDFCRCLVPVSCVPFGGFVRGLISPRHGWKSSLPHPFHIRVAPAISY